uniref:Uncharacterized protein n=1 Tax=Cannabis sativa TaxID=3483 RepID=A0A803Q192_CANSA
MLSCEPVMLGGSHASPYASLFIRAWTAYDPYGQPSMFLQPCYVPSSLLCVCQPFYVPVSIGMCLPALVRPPWSNKPWSVSHFFGQLACAQILAGLQASFGQPIHFSWAARHEPLTVDMPCKDIKVFLNNTQLIASREVEVKRKGIGEPEEKGMSKYSTSNTPKSSPLKAQSYKKPRCLITVEEKIDSKVVQGDLRENLNKKTVKKRVSSMITPHRREVFNAEATKVRRLTKDEHKMTMAAKVRPKSKLWNKRELDDLENFYERANRYTLVEDGHVNLRAGKSDQPARAQAKAPRKKRGIGYKEDGQNKKVKK